MDAVIVALSTTRNWLQQNPTTCLQAVQFCTYQYNGDTRLFEYYKRFMPYFFPSVSLNESFAASVVFKDDIQRDLRVPAPLDDHYFELGFLFPLPLQKEEFVNDSRTEKPSTEIVILEEAAHQVKTPLELFEEEPLQRTKKSPRKNRTEFEKLLDGWNGNFWKTVDSRRATTRRSERLALQKVH